MSTPEDLVTCLTGATNLSDLVGTPGYEDNNDGTYSPGGADDIDTRAASNPYTPTTAADWPTPVPTTVGEALDCAIQRVCDVGGLFISVGADPFPANPVVGDTSVVGSTTVTNTFKFPVMVTFDFIFSHTRFDLPNSDQITQVAYQIDFGGGTFSNGAVVGSDHHGGVSGLNVPATTIHQVSLSGYSQSFSVCLAVGDSITVGSRKSIVSVGENGVLAVNGGSSLIRWSIQG